MAKFCAYLHNGILTLLQTYIPQSFHPVDGKRIRDRDSNEQCGSVRVGRRDERVTDISQGRIPESGTSLGGLTNTKMLFQNALND